jgi:DNA-binding transcriptional regulator YhcF (GntR family)
MPPKKKPVTLRQIANEVGVGVETVRAVFKELPGVILDRTDLDKIYRTARKLGYDFRKLKIGKRMQYRKEMLDEVLEKIGEHHEWSRADILKFLKECRALVDRVHKRVFREEFGSDAE